MIPGSAAKLGPRLDVAVALLGVLVFLPALLADFVFDDLDVIALNGYVQDLRYAGRAFRTHFWDTELSEDFRGLVYYRPLVTLSFLLDWVVSGGSPAYFHGVNVLGHGVATFLFVRAARRWLGDRRLAWIAGLVFALHPTRTESVIWVVGRTDVFMMLLLLLTLELLDVASRASSKTPWVLGAAATGVAAVLVKEPAVLLALLVGVDGLLAEPGSHRRVFYRKAVVGCALAGGSYLVARHLFLPVTADRPIEWMPSYGLLTVASYLERSVWPWPQTFLHRHLQATPGESLYPWSMVALGAVAAVAYAVLVAWAARRRRAEALLLTTALAFLVPLLNFTKSPLPFTTCDRFLYAPLAFGTVGLLGLIRMPLTRLLEVHWGRAVLAGVLLPITGLAGWVDVARAADYESDEALWKREHELNPPHPLPLANLAIYRAAEGRVHEAHRLMVAASAGTLQFPLWNFPAFRMRGLVRLLQLKSAVTADGDIVMLGAIDEVYEALLDGRPPPKARALVLGVDLRMSKDMIDALVTGRSGDELRAAAALVGSRLGHAEQAARHLAHLPDEALMHLPDPVNVALAQARIFDFSGARRRLARLGSRPQVAPPWFARSEATRARMIADANGRIANAEKLRQAAETAGFPDAAILRAQALVELGAYLRALRVLYPALRKAQDKAGLASLYSQLLVAARLETAAVDLAARFMGRARARAEIEAIRSGLPASLRELAPVACKTKLCVPLP